VYNIKGDGDGGSTANEGAMISNLRRCGGDIGDSFGSAVGEFMTCQQYQEYAGKKNPYGYYWNDPDSLEVGNGKQTKQEYMAHFTMW
jgi:alpha-galactosidase